MTRRVAIAALAIAGAAPALASPLDPYRELARGSGARALLVAARAVLEGTPEADRATDAPPGATLGPRAEPPDWPAAPVGVYLSLVRGRETRACVGSAEPIGGSLSATVRALAAEALRADRRRPPVRRDEMDDLRIVIAFAADQGRLASPYDVDPGREGLLVATARGRVAFLPGEVRTVGWALREARRAGILDGGAVEYRRLEVVAVAEPAPVPGRSRAPR